MRVDPLKPPAAPHAGAVVGPGDRVCASAALVDGGHGIRFTVIRADRATPAFAVRFQGVVYAYINRCAHQSVELDWNEGDFFSADHAYLVCATHGARYHPATGACVDGRCNGKGLHALVVEDTGDTIVLRSAQ
jgi:nitrite reductase/ring-hydroxylating ferredoxin subunit